MLSLDEVIEQLARRRARTSSRRGFIGTLGAVLVGAALVPLIPVRRSTAFAQDTSKTLKESGDPLDCNYWRHCAIDGYLCGCCGGSATSCPPGTVVSDITWIGTCHNPTDGKDYVISYNDCCGLSDCGACPCNTNKDDTPIYRPQTSNNINWCAGSQADVPYHCSLSVVIAVAE